MVALLAKSQIESRLQLSYDSYEREMKNQQLTLDRRDERQTKQQEPAAVFQSAPVFGKVPGGRSP